MYGSKIGLENSKTKTYMYILEIVGGELRKGKVLSQALILITFYEAVSDLCQVCVKHGLGVITSNHPKTCSQFSSLPSNQDIYHNLNYYCYKKILSIFQPK